MSTTELTTIIPSRWAARTDEALALADGFAEQNLIQNHAVLVDLRGTTSVSPGFLFVIIDRIARQSPERIIVLGAERAERATLLSLEQTSIHVNTLARQRKLFACDRVDDLVMADPSGSPLDAALFEQFMLCEM